MNAFVLEGSDARLVSDRREPEAPPGFVRVRTRLAGICNTDLELVRGYMGFRGVLGHEFVGEAVEGRFAGQRVVGGINFACGHCPTCAAGLERHCPSRTVLGIMGSDGVFAEQFVIPERNLLAVPEQVADETAVFTEPVAAAHEILEQLGNVERGRALVLGDGKLGLLIAQVLAVEGFAVDLAGHHLDGLGWMEKTGVTLAGNGPSSSPYPLVVEATGSPEGLTTAISATAPRGVLVLKTTVAGSHEVDLAPVVINEITVLGSRCGSFQPALGMLAASKIDTEHLVDSCFELIDVERAFQRAASPGARKVLVKAGPQS